MFAESSEQIKGHKIVYFKSLKSYGMWIILNFQKRTH